MNQQQSHLFQFPDTTCMKLVEDYVFQGCTALKEMKVLAMNPPAIEKNTFEDVSRSIPVYVPAGSLEKYRANEFWGEFAELREM